MEDRIAKLMADWSAWVAVALILYGFITAVRQSFTLPKTVRAETPDQAAVERKQKIWTTAVLFVMVFVSLAASLYYLNRGNERLGEQIFAFWVGLAVAGISGFLDSWLVRLGIGSSLAKERVSSVRAIASALIMVPALAILPIHRMTDGYQADPLSISLALLLGAALGAAYLRTIGMVTTGLKTRYSQDGFGVEVYILLAAALIAVEALGRIRFPKSPAAFDIPYGVLAVSLLSGLTGVWITGVRERGARNALPALAAIVIIGAAGYVLGFRVIRNPAAFYSIAVGLVSGAILWWSAANQAMPRSGKTGYRFVEQAVLAAIMVTGAVILPFRLLGGYGIGLSALGMISLLPLILCLERFSKYNATDDQSPALSESILNPGRAVVSGSGIVLATAFLRILIESYGLRATITLDALYPLVGLILGASAPMVLRALAVQSMPADTEQAGAAAVYTAMKVALWAFVLPGLIALFFGNASVGGFLAGMIAGELFSLLALFLTGGAARVQVENTAIVMWMSVVAVRLGPVVGNWSAALPRGQKVQYVMWLAGIAVAWIILSTIVQQLRRKNE